MGSQNDDLFLKSGDKGLYLTHKVVAKESFYSIGRLYNTHPKSIANYNKLDMGKGLGIGQLVNIPLTDTNFSQKGNTGTPVYYKVGEKEGLMKVSSSSKDVSLANLRLWNNLANDNVKPGTKLIVGFVHSPSLPSITINNKPRKEEAVVTVEEKPVVIEEKTVVKVEPKKEESKKEEVKKEEVQKPQPDVKYTEEKPVAETGFFKYHFEQQLKTRPATKDVTVTSGIFKTTSGWMDAKYYLLIDGVAPGVIVRVVNPSNNKAIYAKVLGEMTGIRQNEGLNIRVSSAAASALQIAEQDKFIVRVNY